MFLQTFQETYEDTAQDCNEHVKGAMEKVLLMSNQTIPNIQDEKKKIDFQKRVEMMGVCVLLFLYSHADEKKLSGRGGFKHLFNHLEKTISDEKINEIVQTLFEFDVAFQFGSLKKEPHKLVVQIGPHSSHNLIEFTSRVGLVSCPFLGLVKDCYKRPNWTCSRRLT